ncbi:MAG: 1-deoxy-D-xylulose-5-phosphate reductoisomerase [Clostridia bacterium]|nr:1-deoxy-D-xylulose-5-phosphate reductoisomerase [Clostridia bacterium]
MKKIALLGSTGSIGTQTLEVAREKGYKITALAARRSIDLLEAQIREFRPEYCAVADEKAAADLKIRVADTDTKILSGDEGIIETAAISNADILLNSLLGKSGIRPTLAAIESGKDIAMANKEPLVASGEIILGKVKEKGVRFLPVDSEHSAIFQCLDSEHNSSRFISRLIITASGGPFFSKTREELKDITPAEAIAHPTWSMGAKISVDSATLMNKGLELIEAARLFNMSADRIDVTVHRQSIVHSMVEFCDGSTLAQLGHPDMKHCIQFALTYPERSESLCKKMDYTQSFTLTFAPPDEKTFTLLPLARRAITLGGTAPAVLNGAGERAVELFLSGKIGFLDIFDTVESAVNSIPVEKALSLEIIEEKDRLAREHIDTLVGARA